MDGTGEGEPTGGPFVLDRSGGVYREELMVPLRLVPLKLVLLRLGREESEDSHESERGRGCTPGSSASGSASDIDDVGR